MRLVEKIVDWSKGKRNSSERIVALFTGAIVFCFLLPLALVLCGYYLDSLFGFPKILEGLIGIILGFLVIIVGWPFALWAVYIQYKIGKGTPLPVVPTQKLIISGPYRYCRNPMMFGTLLFYCGLAIILNSLSMLFLIMLIILFITIYLKLVEEKELEARFGEEYLEYKKRTPFMIPRPIKIGKKSMKNSLG